jgi:hypothetical protein
LYILALPFLGTIGAGKEAGDANAFIECVAHL